MNAPTVWEEGHWSGSRITRLSAVLAVLLLALDLALSQRLSPLFDVGFVALCVFMALAVHPRDFFRIGVLPPLLLLGTCLLLGAVRPAAIADPQDGVVQAVVSGLAHHSGALLVGYTLALAVLAIRHRVIGRGPHSNRSAAPAPYRAIAGVPPSEKSTTVVGEEPHSPESMTASRT